MPCQAAHTTTTKDVTCEAHKTKTKNRDPEAVEKQASDTKRQLLGIETYSDKTPRSHRIMSDDNNPEDIASQLEALADMVGTDPDAAAHELAHLDGLIDCQMKLRMVVAWGLDNNALDTKEYKLRYTHATMQLVQWVSQVVPGVDMNVTQVGEITEVSMTMPTEGPDQDS